MGFLREIWAPHWRHTHGGTVVCGHQHTLATQWGGGWSWSVATNFFSHSSSAIPSSIKNQLSSIRHEAIGIRHQASSIEHQYQTHILQSSLFSLTSTNPATPNLRHWWKLPESYIWGVQFSGWASERCFISNLLRTGECISKAVVIFPREDECKQTQQSLWLKSTFVDLFSTFEYDKLNIGYK